ncbi:hypothetical protein [Chryseobacterium sp.]|uniref:hypothetical protein n=1 Tax=Chryseobacterium sp. TaxID=1871047 RepID=UPI0025BE2451|nr:hypothetical protein [Chryseobacterium sp.]MBV8328434.1 hypothetical protein [Chryseobacterium sp.]
MFVFTYTFKREINNDKTLKNVTDAVYASFMEREMKYINIEGNRITGKDSLIKLDFSNRSPLVFSPGKEYFIYDENTKVLTYKIEAIYPVLFNLIYSSVLFLILYKLVHHPVIELAVPFLFFILITITGYFQYQMIMGKVCRKLVEE